MGRIIKELYWVKEPKNVDGQHSVVAHILEGYCPVTMADYERLLGILQEDFPQATDKTKIECSKVTGSDRVKGFTLLIWKGFADRGEYEGWWQNEPDPDPEVIGIKVPYYYT